MAAGRAPDQMGEPVARHHHEQWQMQHGEAAHTHGRSGPAGGAVDPNSQEVCRRGAGGGQRLPGPVTTTSQGRPASLIGTSGRKRTTIGHLVSDSVSRPKQLLPRGVRPARPGYDPPVAGDPPVQALATLEAGNLQAAKPPFPQPAIGAADLIYPTDREQRPFAGLRTKRLRPPALGSTTRGGSLADIFAARTDEQCPFAERVGAVNHRSLLRFPPFRFPSPLQPR